LPGPLPEAGLQEPSGAGVTFGPSFTAVEPTTPTEPMTPAAEVGAPVAFPPGLFGATAEASSAEVSAEGVETIRGTELAAAATPAAATPAAEMATQDEDTDRDAGPRHVHDRELVWALQRRMIEERERMGGFGALIR
jgi:hypothetical protein